MFTGIVAGVGSIIEIKTQGEQAQAGVRLTIHSGVLSLSDVQIGDSIAVQGACMTVVEKTANTFCVDVSRESLNKTTGLDGLLEVNLEKALTLAERLGGHLVTGHVDGLGEVVRFAPVAESWLLAVKAPKALGKYFAYKGSATVNGVSLTVNNVVDQSDATVIEINLIPHTIAVTTLKHLTVGTLVNLEIDVIARYVARMVGGGA